MEGQHWPVYGGSMEGQVVTRGNLGDNRQIHCLDCSARFVGV